MFAHELKGTQIFIAQAGECEYKMSIWTVMHWLQQVYSKSEGSMGDYTGKFFSSAVVPDSFNAQKALSLYSVLSASPFCSIPFLSLSYNSQVLWAWTKTQGNLKNKKINYRLTTYHISIIATAHWCYQAFMKSHIWDNSISSLLWNYGNVHYIFYFRNSADLDILYLVSYRHWCIRWFRVYMLCICLKYLWQVDIFELVI